MAIILRLDRVMADRKISLNELSARVGISNVNLSNLKTGKVKAIRFFYPETPSARSWTARPEDILEYRRMSKRRTLLRSRKFRDNMRKEQRQPKQLPIWKAEQKIRPRPRGSCETNEKKEFTCT